MNERHETTEQNRSEAVENATVRGNDDRRRPVSPTERRVPNSPEPEPDSVRKGMEKLERVKPY